MTKIEGIIICVNYSDFLDITLDQNLKHFDQIIVVTDEKDIGTHEICKKYNHSLNSWY